MFVDKEINEFNEKVISIKKTNLSDEDLKAFAKELDVLKKEIESQLGQEDVDYLLTVDKISRYTEILGRILLHFSLDLASWATGVFLLYVHFQLNNLEIKHHALHGAYDRFPNVREFHSDVFVSNSPVDEESWKYRHNHLHHSYTNQVDKDPDVTFGLFRLTELVDKQFFHLFQPFLLFLNALGSDHNLNMVSTGLYDFINRVTIPNYEKLNYASVKDDYSFNSFIDSFKKASRKAIPYMAYNHLLFPALAGPFGWLKVSAGTTLAMTIRNLVSGIIFYTGHMTEGVKHYTWKPENRAEWYVQQIEGSSNVSADRLFSILVGHLNYQIEHHLFPKMPPNRLEEVSPRVQEICKKYGVNYNTGNPTEQVISVFRNAFKHSFLIK
jgi:fatty acid desaturase